MNRRRDDIPARVPFPWIIVGFAITYDIVDLVGTQVSIAAKLPKSALAKLRKVS